ncbi:MAG: FkbM family methyltransferase [Gemmatimonadales bacterium]|nr:FkbM family methyltransferase [Gemmatimonadales bacterium]MBP6570534.1 FkbM family methyltransferase [Gemmatimonadales bacterium]MBP7619869.1 FkbM family methyltransferase [Gemmatimonadales bacterium]MBP9897900.1 FkbM family methyltransferase [Gemmatimonadales bacterium]
MQLGIRHLMKSLLGRIGVTYRPVGRDRLLEVRGVDAEQRRVDRTDWMATEHLIGLLERYQIDTVLDVGANEGQFGTALRHGGYAGRLISFEPASPTRARLAARAAADPLWEVQGCALGDADTTVELTLRSASTLTSLLPPDMTSDLITPGAWHAVGTEHVPVRRLDTLWDELALPRDGRRVFLKVDAQGYDETVLAGATGVFQYLRGVQTEVAFLAIYQGEVSYHQRLQSLERAGFALSGLFGVVWEPGTDRLAEGDAILLHLDVA